MMKNFFKTLFSNSGSYNMKCSQHKQTVKRVCCFKQCKAQSVFICQNPHCMLEHRGHLWIDYKAFEQTHFFVQKEIQFKNQIRLKVNAYKNLMISSINSLFQKAQKNMLEYIDKNFSSKQLLQIQKSFGKFQNNVSSFKDKAIEYLQHFVDFQQLKTRKYACEQICKKIKESQKKMSKLFSLQLLGLDSSILPDQHIKQIISYSKVDKLKQILPFKCQLIQKFQASKFNFLSASLYNIDIRGPIILLVQSHKHRIFGGYSPVMFPKSQEYIEDKRKQCFLFSLDDKCILPIKEQYAQYSIRGGKNFWFGRGDLQISDECQKGNINWAQIGRAYKAPALAYGNQSSWLAGAWYYRVIDYYIYQVQIQRVK